MSKYASKSFWVDVFDRAVSTFTQALAGALGGDAIGFVDIDWQSILGIAGIAALSSVLWTISYRGKGEEYVPDEQDDVTELEELEVSEGSDLGKHGIEAGAQVPVER